MIHEVHEETEHVGKRLHELQSSISAPLEDMLITSGFWDKRIRAFGYSYHKAEDYRAKNSKLFAPYDGKVKVGWSPLGGRYIIVTSDVFNSEMTFCHLSKVKVKNNSYVKKGDFIAITGASGKSLFGTYVPHLHASLKIHTNEHTYKIAPSDFFKINPNIDINKKYIINDRRKKYLITK